MFAGTHFFLSGRAAWVSEFCNLVSILVCVATEFESELLRETVRGASDIRLIQTGIGPVNAAHAVTVAILRQRPASIISCGIAGAYPSSGLRVGDVVCASEDVYGDLGAQSPTGFLNMRALGFPVVTGEVQLFDELPMQLFPASRRVRFVTVSTCTGTSDAAAEIELRTGGAVENMEGAAIAHVAHLHNVAVGEVRAISNIVTNRDKASWRIKEAAEAAQLALLDWLRTSRPQDLKTSRP
jgi:futalosine hydrolase